MGQFIRNVGAVRGREIRLVAMPDEIPGVAGPCGLSVRHRAKPLDLIVCAQGLSGFDRTRVIYHEIGHLWCADGEDVDRVQLMEFFPGMASDMADRLCAAGRISTRVGAHCGTRAEVRAELLADVLYAETRVSAADGGDPVVMSLQESLTRPLMVPRWGTSGV